MKIVVDISSMVTRLHYEWNGEGHFKVWLRRKENTVRMENKIRSIIIENNIDKISFNLTERLAKIEYNENASKSELYAESNKLTFNDLLSYVV